MYQTLRRAGGSLVMTVPKSFIEQNHLQEGSQVELTLQGPKMIVVSPQKPHYSIESLMSEMQEGLPRVEGWDAMPDIGQESC